MARNLDYDPPVAVTGDNYSKFTGLLGLITTDTLGELAPDDIETFQSLDRSAQYKLLNKDGVPKAISTDETTGNTLYAIIWRHPDTEKPENKGDFSKDVLLIIEMVEKGEETQILPRQYVLGEKFYGIAPYQVSCCDGRSAVLSYPQDGTDNVIDLIENPDFVHEGQRDIFDITDPNRSNVGTVTNDMISHIAQKIDPTLPHKCNHAPIEIRARSSKYTALTMN